MATGARPSETPPDAASPNILDRAAAGLNGWLGAHQGLYLAIASLLCVATFTGYARHGIMWADESLELSVIRAGNLQQMWNALMDGIQTHPPVLDLATQLLFRVFGDSLFVARMPSALCFCLMCLCLARIVWRYAPPSYAAATFFLPFATTLREWGSGARPYAPMLGFSALTLLCWDNLQNTDGRRQVRWRIAFLLSLAMTLSTHFYAILILLPLGLGELAKWILRKRPDWPTILCFPVALVPYCLWLPVLISGGRIFLRHYASRAEFQTLYEFFGSLVFSLPWVGIVLLLFAAAGLGAMRAEAAQRPWVSQAQRLMLVVSCGFLLLPFCGYLLGVLWTGWFPPKYYMIAAFGLILGLPLLLPALTSWREAVGLCVFLAMAGHGLLVGARGVSYFWRSERPYPSLAEIRRLIPDPQPDIVFSAPMHVGPFLEANRSDTNTHVLYLFDPQKELAEYGNDTSDTTVAIIYERSIRLGHPSTTAAPFDAYVATHRHFFILCMGEVLGIQEWQFKYLLNHLRARMLWLGKAGVFDVYQVDLPALAPAGQ